MRFDPDDLLVIYDVKAAARMGSALVGFAEMGLTMVAGDPSRFVGVEEAASAVVVNGGMLTGERDWGETDVRNLANLAREANQPGARWSKCPECGHEHYDAYGGVPCGVPSCNCQRSYMPRAGSDLVGETMCAVCEMREATYDGRFCSSLCGWASVLGGKVREARKNEVRRRP
jgi:hypothetical protein